MIVKTMPVGPIGTNCYLLGDETSKACAMIDPGGDPNEILSMIREAGLALKAILLTHGHYDHTGGVAGLEAAFPGTPVYLHRADAEGVNPTMFPPLPREVLRFYDEGDTVAVGGLTVEVLHTPGHSKGSVVLKTGDILFTGDTLFRGSIGTTMFGGSDAEMHETLEALYRYPGDYGIYPGHGESTSLSDEKRDNPFFEPFSGV